MTAAQVRALPDDAPCSMFAVTPVTPYRHGFEDAQDAPPAWFCPWRAGTVEAQQYRRGWQDGKAQREVMQ